MNSNAESSSTRSTRHGVGAIDLLEREELRKMLHDGLGQMLTSATFVASSLRHRLAALDLKETAMVDEMISLLNEAIAESRTLAARCEPPSKTMIGDQRPTFTARE